MSIDQVECPICSQNFPQETIEKHVDKCLLISIEKPVTRGKNKSPTVFFNRKNGKRSARNKCKSPVNKKVKIGDISDLNIKLEQNDGECATESNEKEFVFEMHDDDDGSINKDLLKIELDIDGLTNDDEFDINCKEMKEEVSDVLTSPNNSNISSIFFDKKSRKRGAKANINNKNRETVKEKKTMSSIDLTKHIEKENNKSESNETGKYIRSCNKEYSNNGPVENSHDTFKINKDEHSLTHSISSKEVDSKEGSKLVKHHFFQSKKVDSVKLNFENKNGDGGIIGDSRLPIVDSSPTEFNNTFEECSPGCSKNLTKQISPPSTPFQQELFNMSLGNDALPSPPAKTNFREKIATAKRKSDKIDKPCFVKNEIILGKLPLSEQMRPQSLDDYVGQVAISTQKLLKELFYNDIIPSMILWGPPGCGKTSLAHVISHQCKSGQRYRFVKLSATMSGVNDVKEAVKIAKNEKKLRQKHTVLFIDEVHRFNKMQQDSFLPHIEDGTIVLIGATTENPSFHLNNALISRCRIIVLNQLNVDSITTILNNAVSRLGGMEIDKNDTVSRDSRFTLEGGVVNLLAEYSNGDARVALTGLDMILQAKLPSDNNNKLPASNGNDKNTSLPTVTCEHVKEELRRGHINYDRKGDEHYDIISAFHKSIRGGDPDAALYWLARMLEGGEEPLYIARRLIRIASEDIGVADPLALNQAVSAYQACQFIGMPECDVILAQVATYLSKAPKSIAVYKAYNKAKTFIKDCVGPQPMVPLHLRNAPTKLMKNLGYGKGYKYTPNCKDDPYQDYLPKDIVETKFFTD